MSRLRIIIAVLLVGTSTVVAGLRQTALLELDPAGSFSGSIGAIRNDSDPYTYIGCNIMAGDLGTVSGPLGSIALSAIVLCTAGTKDASLTCWSWDPAIIDTARGINGDDFLKLEFDPELARCTHIHVRKHSYWEPKQL